MKHKVEILEGNQGFVVTINEYRITHSRHNGIMHTLKSWDIDDSVIQEALKQNFKPSDNSSSKKDCFNKRCKRGYCFDNQCHWKFMYKCEERKRSPS